MPCDDLCKVCYGGTANDCEECEPPYYLLDHTCSVDCIATYYKGANYECTKCSSDCYTCEIEATRCTACDNGRLLLNNICYPANGCPGGYWEDDAHNLCVECDYGCETCNSAGLLDCGICDDGFYKYGTECKGECPDGYWENDSTKNCDTCDPNCEYCGDSTTHCTKCSETKPSFLKDRICVPASGCGNGLYASTVDYTCKACK